MKKSNFYLFDGTEKLPLLLESLGKEENPIPDLLRSLSRAKLLHNGIQQKSLGREVKEPRHDFIIHRTLNIFECH